MSQADKLLESVASSRIAAYSVDSDTEGHFVVGSDRVITVPDELKRIAVQYDHKVETVTFDCPRYWDGLDMSKMKVYINYIRKDNALGMYIADNVRIDDTDTSVMHFEWTITKNATMVKGQLAFLVCIKKTDDDGNEENHWHSELNTDLTVSEGLECEDSILEDYPDVVTQLLIRMDKVEAIATVEAMQGYVDTYLNDGTIVKEHVYSYLTEHNPTSPADMILYVKQYLTDHPPVFAVGSRKPDNKCLWFNTGENGESIENTYVDMIGDARGTMQLKVEGVSENIYDFTIK